MVAPMAGSFDLIVIERAQMSIFTLFIMDLTKYRKRLFDLSAGCSVSVYCLYTNCTQVIQGVSGCYTQSYTHIHELMRKRRLLIKLIAFY